MPNELAPSSMGSADYAYLNEDATPATWITSYSKEERQRRAVKPILIGGLITFLFLVLQYSYVALMGKWWASLWPLGIGIVVAYFKWLNKGERHFSTYFIAYSHRERIARSWKWLLIPSSTATVLEIFFYKLGELKYHWGEAAYLMIFTIPGLWSYFNKGQRVLIPKAAEAKNLIEALAAEARRSDEKIIAREKYLNSIFESTWF